MAITRKVNMSTYMHFVKKLGKSAAFINVESTNPAHTFSGLFTDETKTSIIVLFPVDQSKDIQARFIQEFGDVPMEVDTNEYTASHQGLTDFNNLLGVKK